MNEIVSGDKILEGCKKLEDIEELFDADLLILTTIKQDEGKFHNKSQNTDIKSEFTNVTIKCYCMSQKFIPCYTVNQVSEILNSGNYVILTLAGMVMLSDFIKEQYENKTVNINFYIRFKNDKFLYIPYDGKASDVDKEINEILDRYKTRLLNKLWR